MERRLRREVEGFAGRATARRAELRLLSDLAVSPEELQDLVDRFGEDVESWPNEFRQPASDLIDDCAEAKAIIEQAKALRQMLRNMGPHAPDCIADRIISVALELDPPQVAGRRRQS